MALRGRGKVFANIQAQHQRLQIYIRKDEVEIRLMFLECDMAISWDCRERWCIPRLGNRVKNLQILTKAVRPISQGTERMRKDHSWWSTGQRIQIPAKVWVGPQSWSQWFSVAQFNDEDHSLLSQRTGVSGSRNACPSTPVYGAQCSPFTTHHKRWTRLFSSYREWTLLKKTDIWRIWCSFWIHQEFP